MLPEIHRLISELACLKLALFFLHSSSGCSLDCLQTSATSYFNHCLLDQFEEAAHILTSYFAYILLIPKVQFETEHGGVGG